ncbi:MAG: autotransporter domain-containing protein [Candidatus Omnitrophota bacterium]
MSAHKQISGHLKASSFLLGFGAVLLAFAAPAHALTYNVLNTGDAGADTLRAAVTSLNSSGVAGTIAFGSGAAGTIALESNLDTLGFETIFNTSNYNITLTGHNGGTSAGSWFKFDGAGTGTFTFGTGTAWTIGGGLVVGDNANGSMTISGGGDVTNAFTSYVGGNAGSSGAVTVTGAGSTWVNTQDTFIGSGSTGTLTISNGGVVSDTYGNIGGFAGGNGTVTVTGAGSQWNNTNDIFVGKNDDGVLNILAGGVVNDDKGFVASEVGSTGIVNVDGANSKWTNTGGLTVGRNAPGELHITDGGAVSNTYVDLAYSGTGIATVDGNGSTWDSDGDFNVGKANTATLDVTDDGDVISNFGYVGRDATANGTATIDGAGSTWTNDFGLTVGDSGTGKLIISDGGSVSVTAGAGTTTIASVGGSTGTLTIGAGGASGSINTAVINGGSGTATLKFNHTDAGYTFAPQLTGSLKVEQNGAGTTIISGNNTYTGTTTVNAGTLRITTATGLGTTAGATSVADGATLDLNGTFDVDVEAVTLAEGSTLSSSSGTNSILGTVTVAGTSIADVASSLTLSGSVLGSTGPGFQILDKTGAGTLTLSGTPDNTSLAVTVDAGTLILAKTPTDAGFNAASRVVVNGGTLQLGGTDNRQIWDVGLVTLNGGTFDQNGKNETIGTLVLNGGTISGLGTLTINSAAVDARSGSSSTILAGTQGLTKTTAGTVTLSGANTYSGATAINAGTLVASNSSALGNGSAVTVAAGATLDVGTTDVTVNNTYTQNGTLKVTVASPSSSGKITSNAAAAVAATSSVDVTVPGSIYIPNNATFTVVDGAGGADVSAPATITSSDPRLRFSALSLNGDLILTANRSGTGFSSISTNSNAAAAGTVLDNISNPSADMTTVLNTLEGLSNSQVASALDTVTPVVDNGVIASSNLSLNQFVGVITERLTGLYARARGGETGVSAGSEGLNGFEAWGQGFGEYLHQDPRGGSNGYCATVWGTAIGGDLPAFNNRVRLGLSGGYSSGDINSKDNSGKTDIDSYQGTLYGGYADVENPYYVNGSFSFAYNKYDGSRHIAVGAIERTADSDYDGQQYSVMFDGGYTLKSGKFGITPIASLQYMRLHLEGYTETNAGALNLSVKGENYDMLQSGLGMKLERPFETKTGTVIPEVHAKWLHDFIGDRQETTSTFAGGGGSFATQGFDPARNAMDVGAKLTLLSENNWSLETNYDFEYKEDFTSHTGWADIRYRF